MRRSSGANCYVGLTVCWWVMDDVTFGPADHSTNTHFRQRGGHPHRSEVAVFWFRRSGLLQDQHVAPSQMITRSSVGMLPVYAIVTRSPPSARSSVIMFNNPRSRVCTL